MLIPSQPIDRRDFLRGTGAAAVALPLLEAMEPSLGRQCSAPDPTSRHPSVLSRCAPRWVSMLLHLFPKAKIRITSGHPTGRSWAIIVIK